MHVKSFDCEQRLFPTFGRRLHPFKSRPTFEERLPLPYNDLLSNKTIYNNPQLTYLDILLETIFKSKFIIIETSVYMLRLRFLNIVNN